MRRRVIASALFGFLSLCAQERKETPKLAVPNPTNLKILKVTTGPEVSQIMGTFVAGLGVQCTYCHAEGNFASDENPQKTVARQMITLVQKINADFPDGKMHVSCYTCHRGETEPKTAPEPAAGQ